MDHEANYFAALLKSAVPNNLRGVSRDHFSERFQPVFDWIVAFTREHRALPRKETVEGQFPGLRLPDANEDVAYFAGRVRENAMRVALEGGLEEHVVQPLEQQRASDALEGAKKVIADVARTFRDPDKGLTLDISSNVKMRAADYALRASAVGAIGLPLPWPTMTHATGGIQIAEVWAILARPNKGKSWFLVVVATVLWQMGYRVLFASMETPPQSALLKDQRHRVVRGQCIRCHQPIPAEAAHLVCPAALIARQRLSIRFDSIGSRLSAFRLLQGCLTPPEKRCLDAYYEACADPERQVKYGWGDLRIVAAPAISTVADVEMECLQFQPDIVLWDSAYLAAASFDKRTEACGHLVRDIKLLAERTGTPVFISWHFNRDVAADATDASVGEAALTDEIGRICDVIIGLFRPQEVEDAGEAIFRTLKVRDGVGMRELKTHFKIKDEVSFSEISSAGES